MKVIIHHGMSSAYDRTARNLLYDFMLRNYKRKNIALKKFISTCYDAERFNAFAFIAPNEITFHKEIEEAYGDALRVDCQNPSFVRVWRDGDTQNYICLPETALFGDFIGNVC